MRLITKILVGVGIITTLATVKDAVKYIAEHTKITKTEPLQYTKLIS